MENIGFASDARGSSSTSWRNVWYGPQDTPVPSNAARTSSSVRAPNHGRSDGGDQVAGAEAAVLGGEVVAGDALEAAERLRGAR